MNFMCKPYIRRCPYRGIRSQQQGNLHVHGQPKVAQGEQKRKGYDGYHGSALAHPHGKQLVVDMVLVGQERVFPVAHPVQIDPHDIEARDEQRRIREDKQIRETVRDVRCGTLEKLQAQHTKYHAGCKAAGVTHEYLFLLIGIAEYIIVEEGYKYPESGE